MESKKEIRKRILSVRDSILKPESINKSDMIINKLISLEDFINAENILAYVSYSSEVDTDQFINTCLSLGKQVFVPKVLGEDMLFIRIKKLDDLVTGYKGIREPDLSSYNLEQIVSNNGSLDNKLKVSGDIAYFSQPGSETDLMIMPGSVFDRNRNRIGYGKGFYDRYLSKGFKGRKYALAFDLQIVEADSFCVDATDIKPDYVITETEIIG